MSALQKFRKTFSFRKKKKRRDNNETSKPILWQEDERKVREGTCSFQVKYLGCIEVFESRGMQVCEEAIKALKGEKRSIKIRFSRHRPQWTDFAHTSKNKQQRAVLYVSGEQLRVVDEISKGLIVDQTIEKVSFCAPDRHHDKGFAYICRDGASRRWMCHGFMSVKETGDRLSHAVGCAFAICLEKKQKREKEAVQVTFNEQGTSFTRMGSFRPATLTERLQDPQSTIIAEPVPLASPPPGAAGKSEVGAAIPRPRASANMIDRQGSLRLFPKLADTSSPFKRDLSLRLNDLPSTLQRQQNFGNGDNVEVSPVLEEEEEEEEAQTKELSSQLTSLSTQPQPPFASVSISASSPPPAAPTRSRLPNGTEAPPVGAFSDPFGMPPRPPPTFDPFATAPAPFVPPSAAAPPPATYQPQSSTNPFVTSAPAVSAATASNPWAAAPSPWAPTPAPRLLGVDRRDGSGDPFDVAWAERQASARESSTNPFVARGLPSGGAAAPSAGAGADKGFRVGV